MTRANRRRAALVGTGHRGLNMWGTGLLAGHCDYVDMVSLCDSNEMRAEHVRDRIATSLPVYTDFDAMTREHRPDLVIVTTRDADHYHYIVAALEAARMSSPKNPRRRL
jgi:predicted dehydrogenase